ncbi:hypothetical protein ACJJJB_02460 [Microbulbifer sp. ANSA001]|uniref:hypothetical protein n=1 Tax=Microbulbifer sp. ANSA001 TaxID=3243358 RepID=UPI004042FDE2
MEQLDRLIRFPRSFKDQIEVAIKQCEGVNQFNSWLKRFNQLTNGIANKSVTYRQVQDHVFELKVMCFLLNTKEGVKITYEPKGIDPKGKDCDLLAETKSCNYLIELKCTHPEMRNTKIPHEYITKNNKLYMNGGNYHLYQSARGHLMDVTRHTEEKIANYGDGYKTVLATIDGFHLDIEDLRDFVFIYRLHAHRPDDPLGKMTIHNLKEPYKQTIDEFWALPFHQNRFDFKADRKPTIVAPLKSGDVPLV